MSFQIIEGIQWSAGILSGSFFLARGGRPDFARAIASSFSASRTSSFSFRVFVRQSAVSAVLFLACKSASHIDGLGVRNASWEAARRTRITFFCSAPTRLESW